MQEKKNQKPGNREYFGVEPTFFLKKNEQNITKKQKHKQKKTTHW